MAPQIDFKNPSITAQVCQKLVDNTPIAYCILDRDFRVHYANDAFFDLKKIGRDAIGNHCYMFSNGGVPCEVCAVRNAMNTKKRQRLLRKDIMADGSVRYLEHYGIPLPDADGEVRYLLEVDIDRTDEYVIRKENHRAFMGIVEALISILDKKDNYTSTHSRDVAEISQKLGIRIGLDEERLEELRLAALLHDLGKIYIHDRIIQKPDRLDEKEVEAIRQHPTASRDLLKHLDQFAEIRRIAGNHHERWDGDGYPDRLAGDAIPLGARIIAIADTYDAVTSTRSYRAARSHEEALAVIADGMGSQFDPDLVREFLAMARDNFPTRKSLTTRQGTSYRSPGTVALERRMSSVGKLTPKDVNAAKMQQLMSDAYFVKAIMDNSPCYYMIIDLDFRILYASDSLVDATGIPLERMLGRQCFEVNKRQDKCFEVRRGTVRCPAVRANYAGSGQRGRIQLDFKGRPCFCDVYAVPLELVDKDGDPFPCTMEILLDRTEVTEQRRELKNDIGGLLDLLFELAANLDETKTSGSKDILRQCETFGEYLSAMQERVRAMASGEDTMIYAAPAGRR